MYFDADFARGVVLGWAEDPANMDLISPEDFFQFIPENGALKLLDVAEVWKGA